MIPMESKPSPLQKKSKTREIEERVIRAARKEKLAPKQIAQRENLSFSRVRTILSEDRAKRGKRIALIEVPADWTDEKAQKVMDSVIEILEIE